MSTEKRFTLKYINEQHISANLYDCGTFIGSIGIGEELIVELLNDLSEENEQLKQDKTNLYRTMSRDRVRYNQFRDKVFCCIDNKIDEFKNGDYGDLPCNTIHMFLDLKQEIDDDLND